MIIVKKSIKLESVFLFGLIVSLFPWISFGLNEMGMQPYFIITVLVALMTFYNKFGIARSYHAVLLLPLLFIVFQFFNGVPLDTLFLRDLISYLAFALSLIFFYEYLLVYGFPRNIFYYGLWIWILACIPQYFFGEQVYSSLLFAKSSADRGFSSLASEPSFFGLHTALISSMLILFGKKSETYKYIFLALVALVLSASLAGFIYHSMFLSIALLLTRRLNLRLIIAMCILGAISFTLFLQNQRFGELINIVSSVGFTELLLIDASSGSRLADVLSPYILSYYNSLAPMGRVITELNDLGTICFSTNQSESFLSCGWVSNDNKIGSYVGSFIFHFGFIILPFIFYMFFQLIKDFRSFIAASILFIASVTTIPLGYPMIAFFYAACLFYIRNIYKRNLYKQI